MVTQVNTPKIVGNYICPWQGLHYNPLLGGAVCYHSTAMGTCKCLKCVVLKYLVVGSYSDLSALRQCSVKSGPSPKCMGIQRKTLLYLPMAFASRYRMH